MKPTQLSQNNIDNIISLYQNNVSLRLIGEKFHIAPERAKKILLENNIEIKKTGNFSSFNYFKKEIIEKYNNGESLHQLSSEYNITRITLSKKISESGIKIREKRVSEKVNINFFSKIDTPEKAYILGFAFADGSISPNRKNKVSYIFSLSIMESDKYLFERIQYFMNDTHKINITFSNTRYSKNKQCILNISCKQIYEDLKALGMDKKEHIPNMPKHLIHHFIRGYFDGDGCVSVSKRNDIEMKFLGTESFLKELNSYINFSVPRYKKNIYEIRKSGALNAMKFYQYIYKDATIYLTRKKEKFICRLRPRPTEDLRRLERN